MNERLKSAIAARNLTVNDLMERTDISKSGLYFLLDGTTTPDKVRFSTISDICKALKINPEWLMYGFGEMDLLRNIGKSQSLRLDSDTIAEAQKALSSMARVNGLPPSWESDPANLALAINTVIEIGTADGGNVIDLMAGIADKLRKGTNAVDGGTKGDSDSAALSSNGYGKPKA